MRLWKRAVRKLFPGYHAVPDIYGRSAEKMIDLRTHEPFKAMAEEARRNGRTLLYFDRLYTLFQAVENLARRSSNLKLLEIGVYKGGGSYFLGNVARHFSKGTIEMYSIDTFEGHSAKDLPKGKEGGHVTGQFDTTRYDDVKAYLSRLPFITVVQNRIQDAISMIPKTFDFIHLDVDIYEPTLFSLRHFGEHMAQGGIIVVDDYGFTTCPGVRQAVEEYVASHSDFIRMELLTGQCLLVKWK